jgi:DNA recombination protein RmuC
MAFFMGIAAMNDYLSLQKNNDMEYLWLLGGLLTGLILAFLYFQQRVKALILKHESEKEKELNSLKEVMQTLESDKKILEAREIELREEMAVLSREIEQEREKRVSAEKQVVKLEAEKKNLEKELEESRLWKEKFEQEQKLRIEVEKKYSALSSDFENVKKLLEEEKKRLDEVKQQMQQEFRLIANEILKNNSEEFSSKSKKELNELINPLKEKIEKFEKKVDDTYEKGLKDQTELQSELKKIYELSKQLDKDAKNLTKALKSDSKQQGNWGEVVLERILEDSGLIKGQEYFVQETGTNVEGKTIRPDVIIRLPEDKFLIIDAKVSLTAYQDYISAETDAERDLALKRHIESVRKHVKELSEKNYPSFNGKNTPDFVLMFMPVEPAFASAIQNDHSLFTYAWDRKVVIVSPTTLLATLRTIESIWRQEKQTRNAMEIARQAGALYDKFVGFTKDLEKVGNYIDKTRESYEEARKKLSEGRGNIVRQVEKLKSLGAKTQKELDRNLLDE